MIMENYQFNYTNKFKKKSRYGHIFKGLFHLAIYVSAASFWLTTIPNHLLMKITYGFMNLCLILIITGILAMLCHYTVMYLRKRYRWAKALFRV